MLLNIKTNFSLILYTASIIINHTFSIKMMQEIKLRLHRYHVKITERCYKLKVF